MDIEKILYDFKLKRDPTKEKRELLKYLALMVLVLFVSIFINTQVLSSVYVDGTSMLPTIESGDILYINKLKEPDYNDIIVITAVVGKEPYIKRVIGLEGDSIKCHNGILEIKYSGENKFTVIDDALYTYSKTPEISEQIVGENEIYFLGDNRANSHDSTELGCLPIDNVVGVVTDWSLKYKDFLKKLHNIIN